jgi:hypothetical protein
MRVFPATAGLLVRDPVKTDRLPVEGREVEDSPYWQRLLACGDVSLQAPEVVIEESIEEPVTDDQAAPEADPIDDEGAAQ